jgi:WD40 repeat protein/tetratricopeptide (TPR) repeat protein
MDSNQELPKGSAARQRDIGRGWRKQRLIVWSTVVLTTAALAALGFVAWTEREQAQLQAAAAAMARQEISKARQETYTVHQDAYLREAQYLTDRAIQALEKDNDPTTALLLSLEAMPDSSSDDSGQRGRPLWGPAEVTLEAARRLLREKRIMGVAQIGASAVAVTKDGTRLITNSKANTLSVWDLSTGRELAVMHGHSDGVNDVAVLPDGNRVVSGSYDRTARVWDVTNGRELMVLRGHDDAIYGVAVSPDGKHILTASSDRTVRVWNSLSGGLEAVLRHNRVVFTVAVTKDGLYAVTGSQDGTRIWELASGTEVTALSAEEALHLALTPDGERLITSSGNTARVWKLADGHEDLIINGVKRNVAVTPDSKLLIDDERQWDLETGQALSTHLSTPLSWIRRVVTTPNGEDIVVPQAFDTSTVAIVRLKQHPELAVLQGHKDSIWSVAVTPDGKRLITGSHDKTARIWDLATGKQLAVLSGHTGPLQGMAVTADGTRLLTTSMDLTVRVWDLANYRQLAVLNGHTDMVRGVAVTPDGTRAVTGSEDKTLRVWDLASGQQLTVLKEDDADRIWSVAMAPDGNRVVTGYDDGTARVWDISAGRQVQVFRGHQHSSVMSVAVTPDGTRAITGSVDGTIRVWDLGTGQELLVLRGHKTEVRSIAVTADGKRLVTGSDDNTIRVWDLASGRELAVIKGHENYVTSVALVPDGERLVSGSFDKTARIWALFAPGQALVEGAKAVAPRCLMRHEREKFHLAPSPPSWCTTLKKWPYDAGGLVSAGFKSETTEEAEAKFRAALAQDPTAVRQIADLYIMYGSFDLSNAREEIKQRSEPLFVKALQYDPSAGERISGTYVEQGKKLLEEGKEDEAGRMFDLARKYQTDIEERIERARIEGRVVRGGKLLTQARNERDVTARKNKRLVAIAEFDKAIDLAKGSGAPQGLLSNALLNRGQAYFAIPEYRAAIDDFYAAVALGDNNARDWLFWANNWLGQQLFNQGSQIEGLLKVWTNILDLEPITRRLISGNDLKSNSAMLSLGRIHAEMRIAQGTETPTECEQLASHFADPFRITSPVSFDSIDPIVALPACERAVSEHPEQPRFRYLRGRVETRAGRIAAAAKDQENANKYYAAALADFESAMKQNYPWAFNNMAAALEDGDGVTKDPDKAADLHAQSLNQLLYCCWVPVARRLLQEQGRGDDVAKRHIVRELTLWAAALGSKDATQLLTELTANGTLEPIELQSKVLMSALPPWLRP